MSIPSLDQIHEENEEHFDDHISLLIDSQQSLILFLETIHIYQNHNLH